MTFGCIKNVWFTAIMLFVGGRVSLWMCEREETKRRKSRQRGIVYRKLWVWKAQREMIVDAGTLYGHNFPLKPQKPCHKVPIFYIFSIILLLNLSRVSRGLQGADVQTFCEACKAAQSCLWRAPSTVFIFCNSVQTKAMSKLFMPGATWRKKKYLVLGHEPFN